MKTCILLFIISFLVNVNGYLRPLRQRREVVGSLDIVSNNVQPIHADVKSEMMATEKVTPPLTFQQSLRKSLAPPSKLELIRSASRLVLLLTLTIAALVELYPALLHLVATFYSFLDDLESLAPPSKLELVRSASRLVLLLMLTIAALVELYPALLHLVATFYSFLDVVGGTMEGLVVWTCLAIFLQFHGVLCDQLQVNRESTNDERIRRNHESDLQKLRLKHEQNKSTKTQAPVDQKLKTIPKPVIKQKLPINERNEPKDVKVINNILEEIAQVAHNHNESKGIHKIRHLVDEIDKQNNFQDHEAKVAKPNSVKTDNKTPKKEEKNIRKVVSEHLPANENKPKESLENLMHKCEKALEIVSSKVSSHPLKTENIVVAKEPMVTSQRTIIELGEEPSSNNENSKKQDVKNGNLIEIKEHMYEEESLHTNPCKYTLIDTYKNWYMGQNYNAELYTDNNNNCNGNNIANYYGNCVTYPTNTYGEYNDGNYYVNFDANPGVVNPVPCQKNEDYTRSRKTWLERDSIIQVTDPNEYQVKTINEDRTEITSVQSPHFCRNYYRVAQKQYSSDGICRNQNMYYYIDPYHCS